MNLWSRWLHTVDLLINLTCGHVDDTPVDPVISLTCGVAGYTLKTFGLTGPVDMLVTDL